MRYHLNSNRLNKPISDRDVNTGDRPRLKRLDIGCWKFKQDGHIGVDILRAPSVDVLADACNLPFRESSIDKVHSSYTLEHIQDNLSALSEIWRVCKPDASIRLILPHFSNPAYYDDLTHKHKYSTRSFEHYDQDLHEVTGYPVYLPQINLKVIQAELRWWPPQIIARKGMIKRVVLSITNSVINFFANASPFFCERIWCHWVGGFYEVEFRVKVVKS